MKTIDIDNFEKILQECNSLVEIIEKLRESGYQVSSLEQLLGSTHHYLGEMEGGLANKLDTLVVDYVKDAPINNYDRDGVSAYVAFSQKYIEEYGADRANELNSGLVSNYLDKSSEIDIDFISNEISSLANKVESGEVSSENAESYLKVYKAASDLVALSENQENPALTAEELELMKSNIEKLSPLEQMGDVDYHIDLSERVIGRDIIGASRPVNGQISSSEDEPRQREERRLETNEEYDLQDELERSLYKGAFQKVNTFDKLKKEFSPSDENLPEAALLGTSIIAHRPQFEGGPLVPSHAVLNISKPVIGLGAKVSFTAASKLDPAVHDHAALEVKALGIKKPYIAPPTEYKEASEPFDFVRMASLGLLKAGYSLDDIKVDKKYQSTLEFAYSQYMKLEFKEGGIGEENDLSGLDLEPTQSLENDGEENENSLELDDQEQVVANKQAFESEIQQDEALLNSKDSPKSAVAKPHDELAEALGQTPEEEGNDLSSIEAYESYEQSNANLQEGESNKRGPRKPGERRTVRVP